MWTVLYNKKVLTAKSICTLEGEFHPAIKMKCYGATTAPASGNGATELFKMLLCMHQFIEDQLTEM